MKRWQGFRRVKPKKKRTWFHVLQVDPKDGYGWFDEMVSLDYGEVYKEKKILEQDIPEYDFRIIMRTTENKWSEVKHDYE